MPFIRISLFPGRTKEQKAKVAAAVTQAMVEHAGSREADVTIIFEEQPQENWAASGKLLSDN